MIKQRSFLDEGPTLYFVATPIGNLSDFSFRAIEVLQSVDVILCEDTRSSKILLDRYEIHKPTTSYHEFNKDTKEDYIISLLQGGKNLALISDAGTPVISDPGYEIGIRAHQEGYRIVPIPGASAFLNALIVSGFPPKPFLYYGFLNAKKSIRESELNTLKNVTCTMIFYESPHRILDTLKSMYLVFGERKVFLARELTKKFEEFLWADLSELQTGYEPKGEYVIVLKGNDQPETEEKIDPLEAIEKKLKEGLSERDAIKEVAKEYGLKKAELYHSYYQKKGEEPSIE